MVGNNENMEKVVNKKASDETQQEKAKSSSDRLLILIAWIAMLIPSSLSIILWREFGSGEPLWWALIPLISLIIIIVCSFLINRLMPIRNFTIILLIIFLLGFGGGWQFGLVPFIREQPSWIAWNEQLPWALSSIFTHLLRLSPAVITVSYTHLTLPTN